MCNPSLEFCEEMELFGMSFFVFVFVLVLILLFMAPIYFPTHIFFLSPFLSCLLYPVFLKPP